LLITLPVHDYVPLNVSLHSKMHLKLSILAHVLGIWAIALSQVKASRQVA